MTQDRMAMGRRRIGRINTLGLYTLVAKETLRFLKVWMQTIGAPAVQALLFFLIFAVVLGGSDRVSTSVPYEQFLAPGLIIMAIIQNAFANASSSLIIGKVQGTVVDVLMPPLSAGELTLGYVLGSLIRAIMVALTLIALFSLLPFNAIIIKQPLVLAYFGIVAAVIAGLIGAITGIWAEKFDHVATITNFVIGPLTLLSGTFYSVEVLKLRLDGAAWLEPILSLNPFFYIINGFRYGFIGESDADPLTGMAVTLVLALLLWAVLYRIFKTGWRLRS